MRILLSPNQRAGISQGKKGNQQADTRLRTKRQKIKKNLNRTYHSGTLPLNLLDRPVIADHLIIQYHPASRFFFQARNIMTMRSEVFVPHEPSNPPPAYAPNTFFAPHPQTTLHPIPKHSQKSLKIDAMSCVRE